MGLETLAASINEERETIEDVYEPFLPEWLPQTYPAWSDCHPLAYRHLQRQPQVEEQPRLL